MSEFSQQYKSEYKEYLRRVNDIVKEPLPETVEESISTIDEVVMSAQLEEAQSRPSLNVGWHYLDRALRGFREREFTVFCGPTGIGKTTLLANLACQFLVQHIPVFVASVETGPNDFLRKMMSVVTGEELTYGESGKTRIKEIAAENQSMFLNPMHVFSNYDSRVSHKRLLADLLYSHEKNGTKVALVDNLNFLMDVQDAKQGVVQMDRAIHDFIVFVKKVPMHVIMVMHPRKTENGRVESEFDIKGSSTAVQEAANVVLWNRLKDETDAPMEFEPKLCREMKLAKVRKNGRGVGSRIIFGLNQRGEGMRECKLL
jgi:KaiC/GvpD/RAD55 family RecA-like ATPase